MVGITGLFEPAPWEFSFQGYRVIFKNIGHDARVESGFVGVGAPERRGVNTTTAFPPVPGHSRLCLSQLLALGPSSVFIPPSCHQCLFLVCRFSFRFQVQHHPFSGRKPENPHLKPDGGSPTAAPPACKSGDPFQRRPPGCRSCRRSCGSLGICGLRNPSLRLSPDLLTPHGIPEILPFFFRFFPLLFPPGSYAIVQITKLMIYQ